MSNFVNVDSLYYAIMTKDDVTGVSYGPVKPLAAAAKISVDPDVKVGDFDADGVKNERVQVPNGGKISLDVETLPLETQADIFGHTLDGVGGIIYNRDDRAPFLAILYRRTKGNGKNRYVKIYKAMFQDPKQDAETIGNNVKIQNDTIEGVYLPRKYDKKDRYSIDEESTGYIDVSSTFFTSIENSDITPPTVASTIPASNATGVATNTTFAWTFNESLAPTTVTPANFYLIKDSDGSIVGATVAYNDATKTVTLTPTTPLASASKYLAVADSDVADKAGNKLVTATKIFTTA